MLPTVRQPKRQSCDRCHAQKLRCSRQGSGDPRLCTRCFRQNAECVYSTPLPKGRPSTHRLTRATTDAASSAGQASGVRIGTARPANTPETPTSATSALENGPVQPLPSPIPDAWPLDTDPCWPDWVAGDLAATVLTPNTNLTSNVCTDTAARTQDSAASPPPNGPPILSNNGTQGYITQLSELLSRLTSAFNATPQELTGSLLTQTSFDSVAPLLLSPNVSINEFEPACSILRDTFSASQLLLEILHQLRFSSERHFQMDTTFPRPDLPSPRGPETIADLSYRSPQSDLVVHHLVLACHSLLLNIFGSILVALQHDATSPFSEGAGRLAPPLADMRLVVLVQLSSYFIGRLQEGVSIYTSLSGREMNTASTSLQSSVDLEAEIQQRLLRLRRVLHI